MKRFHDYVENMDGGRGNGEHAAWELKNALGLITSEFKYAIQKAERGEDMKAIIAKIREMVESHLSNVEYMIGGQMKKMDAGVPDKPGTDANGEYRRPLDKI